MTLLNQKHILATANLVLEFDLVATDGVNLCQSRGRIFVEQRQNPASLVEGRDERRERQDALNEVSRTSVSRLESRYVQEWFEKPWLLADRSLKMQSGNERWGEAVTSALIKLNLT